MPAYFSPTTYPGDWNELTVAARTGASVTAIMNPRSGPVDNRDTAYVNAINALRGVGGKVLGYLPSSHSGPQFFQGGIIACPRTAGKYTPQNLIDCARLYKTHYNGIIDGIFIDEMTPPDDRSVSLADSIEFYRQLYDGLKAIDGNWMIFGNPGSARNVFGSNEGYIRVGSRGGADVIVTLEGAAASYAGTSPDAFQRSYPSTTFATILKQASPASFANYLATARARNVTYIYAADRQRAYEYDQIASNLAAMANAIKAANE